MTDAQLDAKFRAQCEPVVGVARSQSALGMLRRFESLADVRACATACALEVMP
jgi:hypothetical protein